MTDKRFTDIEPQIVDIKYSAELPLFDVIVTYYTAHGMPFSEAKKNARLYITEWVKQETLLKNQSCRLRDESNNH